MNERPIDSEIVTLLDEDGKASSFEHLMTFKYEGNVYIALLPESNDNTPDDEEEVLIFRVESRDGEDFYLPIENEVLLDEVFEEFMALVDEETDAQDEDDE